jgi:hypothetical protein
MYFSAIVNFSHSKNQENFMKKLMFYAATLTTLWTHSASAHSAITYPIVNQTAWFTFYFLGMSAEPSSGGPTCTECTGSRCKSVCDSSISNPTHCQCVLVSETENSPPGRQWINNITLGNDQTFTISYQAYENASGECVGTITIEVYADFYQAPQLTNGEENTVFFDINYLGTSADNSDYSGPSWAIRIAAI